MTLERRFGFSDAIQKHFTSPRFFLQFFLQLPHIIFFYSSVEVFEKMRGERDRAFDRHDRVSRSRSRSPKRKYGDRAEPDYRRRNRSRSRSPLGRYERGRDRSPPRDRREYRDDRERGRGRDRKEIREVEGGRKRSRSPSLERPFKRDISMIKKTISEISLQPLASTENSNANIHETKVANNVTFSGLPPLPDPAEDDIEIPDDLEFEDEDTKRAKEEAEAKRLAEERRKRLEDIKRKHSAPPPAAPTDAAQPATTDAMESTAQLPTESDFLNEKETAEALEHAVAASTTTAAVEDDDEGAHLRREKAAVAAEEGKQRPVLFDIFSASPVSLPQPLAPNNNRLREALIQDDGLHLASNWDDGEGYYRATIGERVGDRFQVMGVLGKGVFATVLKCIDLYDNDTVVAVKMIRNNETMRKAAEKERRILLLLKDNKRFCIKMLTHLDYRHHIAFVFEYQAMNLREALKKFGRDIGIAISAVRIYGRQLMIALHHLATLRVVHADLKLDNILCSEDLKTVKLCDFGSAFFETDTDNLPTPYLVSRFYRAPEIILGLPYDRAIDLWSVSVCLFELFTGHVMFPGSSNNEMLRLMQEVKGKPPQKMLKQHVRSYDTLQLEPHFSDSANYKFRSQEVDAVTGKPVLRLLDMSQPTRPLNHILQGSKAGGDDSRLVQHLCDLLEAGLQLDPSRRLKVQEALRHPFFATAPSTAASAAQGKK